MAINWDESMSVGVELIDGQHRHFVSILDKLSTAIGEGKADTVLRQTFDELDNYVIYHFGTEEKYFKQFKYEGAAEHIKEHRNFVEKLKEIKESHVQDKTELTLRTISFMADWLVNHVTDMDKKYVDCFRDHGLR